MLCRVKEVKIYRKQKEDIGTCKTHLGLLTAATDVRFLPSHRRRVSCCWETGAISSGVGWNSEFVGQL